MFIVHVIHLLHANLSLSLTLTLNTIRALVSGVSRGLCLSMCLCCCLFVRVYQGWMSLKFVIVHVILLPHANLALPFLFQFVTFVFVFVFVFQCSLYMWYLYHMPICLFVRVYRRWLSLKFVIIHVVHLPHVIDSLCPSTFLQYLYHCLVFVTIVVFLSIPVVVGFQL